MVYLENGVGCYVGLIVFDVGGVKVEYVVLEYVNEVKFYVFVVLLYLIFCYIGGVDEIVLLYKLGLEVWVKFC